MPFEMFLELTPKEFFDALWEKEQHEQDIVTAQVRVVCETIRMQTAHLVNIQLPKNKRIMDLKKLMKFQWEGTKAPQTEEEMKATLKAIARSYSKRKNKGKDGKGQKRQRRVS